MSDPEVSASFEANGDGVKHTTTTAPTNSYTHEQLARYNDSDYMSFATLVITHYNLYGKLLTDVEARDVYKLKLEDFTHYMAQEVVIEQLKESGVLRGYETSKRARRKARLKTDAEGNVVEPQMDWRDSTLTPKQLLVANTMLDLIDTRSQKKKLQDLNVSTSLYSTWLKDPVFQNYLRSRAESLIGETGHEAHLALLDKVRMGDTTAIKLYYEMTGQYTPGNAKSEIQQQDFRQLLVAILEIINDEIDDPAVGSRIADKFRALIGARNTADALIDTVQTPPEVMNNRELSPRLKELMGTSESGVDL